MSQQIVQPLQPTSPFGILRRWNGVLNASAVFASTTFTGAGGVAGSPPPTVLPAALAALVGTETASRGIALGGSTTTSGYFDLASPTNFIGHLTRRICIGGLSLSDRVFGVTSPVPVGVESPFQDGLEVSLERAEEIEAEGYSPGVGPSGVGLYLYSGVNMITGSTPVGTGLTFQSGLLRVAQSGENSFYVLTANNLTPVNTGALRIRAVAN